MAPPTLHFSASMCWPPLAPRRPSTPASRQGAPTASAGCFQPRSRGTRPGKPANAQAFVAACKALPATAQATTAAAFGSQWLMSLDFATANNAYSHVMPPNGSSCTGTQTATSMSPTRLGRHRRGDHGDQQSSRRGQRRLLRRLGQVCQGFRRHSDLVGPRARVTATRSSAPTHIDTIATQVRAQAAFFRAGAHGSVAPPRKKFVSGQALASRTTAARMCIHASATATPCSASLEK